jgi:enolase
MSKIKSIKAREIIDSRGNPTVEVTCELDAPTLASEASVAKASVPSGASTGIHEALELRDHDEKRFNGLGVLKAVENVNNEIAKRVVGQRFDQKTLDQALIELDGTPNKSRLGANAILGVSLSFARAKAVEQDIRLYKYIGDLVGQNSSRAPSRAPSAETFKLPQPMFNIINGGKHADSGLDIQEFMVGPVGFDTFARKVQAASEIISALRKILMGKGYAVSVGDEGGFAPKLSSNEEALDLLVQAIKAAGYSTDQVKIGLDAAASSFYRSDLSEKGGSSLTADKTGTGSYHLKIAGKEKSLTSAEMIAWYEKLVGSYPIILIEDGLAEDDWSGFSAMTKGLGDKIRIVGDDLTVTNVKRIQTAIEKKAINSVLIKLNQIGTLTETIEAVQLTKKQGWAPFVSHRSGETTDTFIADLAVGLSCDFIKSGALVRGERVCKYNKLMEIEAGLD